MIFSNRYVRDLAWACFSQPLMITGEIADDTHNVSNCGLALTPARQSRLAQLDADPRPLETFLGDNLPRRLGLYFEKLWQFFLADDPSVDLLAHNLPVRDGGRTLGEFDCLYYCHDRRRTFHLELAVKYYLGWNASAASNTGSAWATWVGPNAADRLDLKLSRLLDHQSRLAQTPEGAAALHAAGIDTPAAEVEVKGWLFRPLGETLCTPHGYNDKRAMGSWLRQSQLRAFLENHSLNNWRVLPRQAWLAPALAETPLLDAKGLRQTLDQHFEHTSQPVQLAQFEGSAPADQEESTRLFIVSDSWPGDTRQP